jgi:thioredoxin-like negative regulator of GroEL
VQRKRLANSKYPSEQEPVKTEADFAFRQAIAMAPANPEAVIRFINLLISPDRVSDSLLVVDEARKLEPDNAAFEDLTRQLRKIKAPKDQPMPRQRER